MENELIFVTTALIDLGFILFMMRLGGKTGVRSAMIVNLILVSTFGSKLISLFGYPTNAGNVFYAAVIFALAVITRHSGQKEGYKAVWITFAAYILFVLMGQFSIHLIGLPESAVQSSAMDTLFLAVPRVALASILGYLAAGHALVFLFSKLSQQKKSLPMQLLVSSIVAQIIDSIVFFPIAFLGSVSSSFLLQIVVVGFVAKVAVACMSLPFLSWSGLVADEDALT